MSPTFIVYQVSLRETTRYEIPMALQWMFDEWRDHSNMLTVYTPRGWRRRRPTIQRVLDSLLPECAELVNQVKATKTPTSIWLRGYSGTITHYDYPF